jgi:hypothetical protein
MGKVCLVPPLKMSISFRFVFIGKKRVISGQLAGG